MENILLVTEDENGTIEHFLNGKHHRVDGPAIIYSNGRKVWCLNDKIHRVGGPAIEDEDGFHSWYINGRRHREDGPAFVNVTEGEWDWPEWWLNGRKYTKEDFNKKMNIQPVSLVKETDDNETFTLIC